MIHFFLLLVDHDNILFTVRCLIGVMHVLQQMVNTDRMDVDELPSELCLRLMH
jgi:hypothetical protein